MMMTIFGIGPSSGLLIAEQAGRVVEQAVVTVDVADAFGGQQFEAPLHFADSIAQRVGGEFRLGDDRRVEMRDAFVVAQLEALRVD
jgi:hypothetical protein